MLKSEQLISIDGRVVSDRDARLGPLTNAALYGSGVFTTAAVVSGRPLFWERHLDRLCSDAGRIGVEPPPRSEIADSLNALLAAKKMSHGRVRVTIFEASASALWSLERERRSVLSITADGPRNLTRVFRISRSPFPINSRSPLAGVKSCNYLENLLALNEARKRGFDEALRPNERGEVASAACANLFWAKNGKIFTPALETGCLAGTTRAFVIDNFGVEEVSAAHDEVLDADAIVLTSAGIGARRAVFENSPVKPEPVADRLIEAVVRIFQM